MKLFLKILIPILVTIIIPIIIFFILLKAVTVIPDMPKNYTRDNFINSEYVSEKAFREGLDNFFANNGKNEFEITVDQDNMDNMVLRLIKDAFSKNSEFNSDYLLSDGDNSYILKKNSKINVKFVRVEFLDKDKLSINVAIKIIDVPVLQEFNTYIKIFLDVVDKKHNKIGFQISSIYMGKIKASKTIITKIIDLVGGEEKLEKIVNDNFKLGTFDAKRLVLTFELDKIITTEGSTEGKKLLIDIFKHLNNKHKLLTLGVNDQKKLFVGFQINKLFNNKIVNEIPITEKFKTESDINQFINFRVNNLFMSTLINGKDSSEAKLKSYVTKNDLDELLSYAFENKDKVTKIKILKKDVNLILNRPFFTFPEGNDYAILNVNLGFDNGTSIINLPVKLKVNFSIENKTIKLNFLDETQVGKIIVDKDRLFSIVKYLKTIYTESKTIKIIAENKNNMGIEINNILEPTTSNVKFTKPRIVSSGLLFDIDLKGETEMSAEIAIIYANQKVEKVIEHLNTLPGEYNNFKDKMNIYRASKTEKNYVEFSNEIDKLTIEQKKVVFDYIETAYKDGASPEEQAAFEKFFKALRTQTFSDL